eukprot:EG_transcript_17158
MMVGPGAPRCSALFAVALAAALCCLALATGAAAEGRGQRLAAAARPWQRAAPLAPTTAPTAPVGRRPPSHVLSARQQRTGSQKESRGGSHAAASSQTSLWALMVAAGALLGTAAFLLKRLALGGALPRNELQISAAAASAAHVPDPSQFSTNVLQKSFSLDLVPGEAAEEYRFDPTALADPAAAATELRQEDLSDERLLQHLRQETTDEEVNVVVWKCLGYRFINGEWDNTDVFPKFRAEHPSPPDLIGVTRTYTQQVDEPTLQAVQRLHRTVPQKYIAALKTTFRHLGWKGYQVEELNPNRRRRAMVTQWLMFYRAELFGVSLEELQRRKEGKEDSESNHG